MTEASVPIQHGMRLWVYRAGDATTPLLVLLHGLFDRWESWEPVLPTLATHFQVLAPDLRGHARSAKPASGYTLADYAADIAALIANTSSQPAMVIGHSLGGLIALKLAVAYPTQVTRIVLEDPPLAGITPSTRLWLEALLEAKHGGLARAEALFAELEPERDPADRQRAAQWLVETADGPFLALLDPVPEDREPLALLHQLHQPTLLLRGDPQVGGVIDDETLYAIREAAAHLAVVEFPGHGHSIHTEAPVAFLSAVVPFLTESSHAH